MSDMTQEQMALLHHLKSKTFVNTSVVRYFQELIKLEKDHTRRINALEEKYTSVFTKTTPDSGMVQQRVILDFIQIYKKMVHKQGKLQVYMEKNIIPEFNTYQMDANVLFQRYETKMMKLIEHKHSLHKVMNTVEDKLDKVQVKVRECELNCYNQLGIKETQVLERNKNKWKLVEQELQGKLQVLEMDYKKLEKHCEMEWEEVERELKNWEMERVRKMVDVYYQYAGLKMEYDKIEIGKWDDFMSNMSEISMKEMKTNKMSTRKASEDEVSGAYTNNLSNTNRLSNTNGQGQDYLSTPQQPRVPPKGKKAKVYQESLRKLSDQLESHKGNLEQAGCNTRVSSFESVGEESRVDRTYYPHNQTIDVLQEEVDVVHRERRGVDDYHGLDFSTGEVNVTAGNVTGVNKTIETTSPKKTHSNPSKNYTYNDSSLIEITQQDFIDETAHPDTTIINNYMYSEEEEDEEEEEEEEEGEEINAMFKNSPKRPTSNANTSVTTIETQHSCNASTISTSPSTTNEAYSPSHVHKNTEQLHNTSPSKDSNFSSSTTFNILKSIPDMEKASSSWNKKNAKKHLPPLPTREADFEDRSATTPTRSRNTSVSTTKIYSSPQRVPPVTQLAPQPVAQPVAQPIAHYPAQKKQMNPPPTMSSPSLGISSNKPLGNATASNNADPLKVAVERMRREREARKQKQLQEKEFLKQQREQVLKMVGDGVAQLEQEQADYGKVSSVTGAKLVPFTKK